MTVGDLVYIERAKLVGGSYAALLKYSDGDASDLPVVDVSVPDDAG